MVIRGGVYAIDLGEYKRGHEQRGKRYGIVMSPSNSELSVATIIPTTTNSNSRLYHPEISFDSRRSFALIEQMRVIDQTYIGEFVGMVTAVEMLEIEQGIAQYLGLSRKAPQFGK